jgi:hypothetical protein
VSSSSSCTLKVTAVDSAQQAQQWQQQKLWHAWTAWVAGALRISSSGQPGQGLAEWLQ